MQKRDIEQLTELDQHQLLEINGGWVLPLVAGGLFTGLIANWSDFKEGIVDGLKVR